MGAVGLEISKEQLCSVANLRSINFEMAIINAVLLHTLTSHIHGMKENYSEVMGIWSSFNISLLPVLFMFTFLYYTDPVSTAMVLLTYCLHLSGQDWLAAFAGSLSVLCRQTNIVWVFLAAAETAGSLVISEVRVHQARTKHPPTLSLTMGGQLWELGQGLLDLARYPWRIMRILGLVVVSCGGYLIVGVAFLAFVHLNQGIVVGDRSARTARLLCSLLYRSNIALYSQEHKRLLCVCETELCETVGGCSADGLNHPVQHHGPPIPLG